MPWPLSLGRWLRGELELQASVRDAAGFLTGLLSAGIGFRRAGGPPQDLRLRILLRDFRRIRKVVFRSRARVRIARRLGAPFLLGRVRRRPFLVGAAVLAGAVLYVLSGSIWFVQVRGTDGVDPAEILHEAAALGLRPGVRRAAIDAAAIASRLPVAVPDLTWAGVTLHGTLATIQVVERHRPRPAYEQATVPGDIVAAHAGIVTGMTVSVGRAVVSPGATVHAGQVLIRGVVPMPVSRLGGASVRELPVHAAGVVIARRWYSAYAEASRVLSIGVPTGRVYVRRSLLIGRFRVNLQGFRGVPFGAYTLRRHVSKPMQWRNILLPVELVTTRYAEVTYHLRRLSLEAAGDMAAAEVRMFLIPHLPPQARIVEERQRVFSLPGNRAGVELQVESEDNIGVFRPAAPAAPVAPAPGAAGES